MRATALVLDVQHRGRAHTIDVPAGARPLAALARASWPLGHRSTEGHEWFLFIEGEAGPDRTWRQDTALWKLYVDAALGGWEPPTREHDVFAFGSTPEQAARLAHHVIKGRKRGTTCWIDAMERDGLPLPTPGLVSIVTDGWGIPLCVIETERVVTGTFGEATEEIAIAEDEGDCTLADWRDSHRTYFETEAAKHGLVFDDSSLLLHEYFRLVRVLQR
ncbi:MAG TPA: ASCH domain-containing protein [Xanthomonadales bacterium]|nr:ASCH domain-containing protein [Xanthomonadales bacterium]